MAAQSRTPSLTRSRWAAVGAAVAVTLGAGGIGLVGAATDDQPVTVLLDEPCRLRDTRPTKGIGGRTTPLGPNEAYTIDGTGPSGSCDVPTDAVGLVTNVTAVLPTAPTDLRLYPTGTTAPNTSNLNPAPGQPPTPNAVTVGLSPAGQFDILNKFGEVHVIIDVAAYLTDHHHDDRYYTRAAVDAELAGKADESAVYTQAEVDAAIAASKQVIGAVSTLAGSGSAGSADDTGTAASFTVPTGLALDAGGRIYVADSGNNKIRKISPAGEVTTFAGSGASGSTDGTGITATFWAPTGVAIDASGHIYVADSTSYKIRKISPAGEVTTFAGSGSQGSADGTGTAASFWRPTGVAVDNAGNVYVADQNNSNIRKISPAGVVTTFAGSGSYGYADGIGAAASFNNPYGVAVDTSGNVYVADTFNYRIRKISPAGVVTTLAGSGSLGSADGTGAAASFNLPRGITVDGAGIVYVADTFNNTIRRISPAGEVTTLAGSGSSGSANGLGTVASFHLPYGVAVGTTGNVHVADSSNHLIRRIL